MEDHQKNTRQAGENSQNRVSAVFPEEGEISGRFGSGHLECIDQHFAGKIDGGLIIGGPAALTGFFGFGPGVALTVGVGEYVPGPAQKAAYFVAVDIVTVPDGTGIRVDAGSPIAVDGNCVRLTGGALTVESSRIRISRGRRSLKCFT